jgi:hypothetical protein
MASCIAAAEKDQTDPDILALRHALSTGDISHPHPELPTPLSAMEANFYYLGLRSSPTLVARSSSTLWEVPSGPEENWKLKELGIPGNHPIRHVWGERLAPQVSDLLKSMKVQWTSLNIVRIGDSEDMWFAPVVLWIGVKPASLNGYDGIEVVSKCLELLKEYDISDVEVEIIESVVERL